MTRKKAGWILIGFAILLGMLRLTDVIDNTVTAVLIMVGVIIYSGAAKKYKKTPQEPTPAAEDQAPPSTPANIETKRHKNTDHGELMKEKNVAWILIGIAIIIGTLRLLDVIDNSITAVFIMLAFIMVTGALMGARKKREKEKAAEEAASQETEEET